MMRQIAYCLVALVALAGCTGRRPGAAVADTRPELVVSIEPLRAMLEPLAGDRFRVVSLMDRSADAESFEPSMARRMAAERAACVFVSGVLPFEDALTATLPDSVPTVDLSREVELLYGTHYHDGHGHEGHARGKVPDPHIWTSVPNARRITACMAETLCAIDPAHAGEYAARRDSLDCGLAALDAYARAQLQQAPSQAFVVWHPSLSYFARDYGLNQVALNSEGKDLSAARMGEAVDRARRSGARVFLSEKGMNPRQARSIASEAGVRVVEIDLMSADWNEQIKRLVDEIAQH